MVVFTLSSSRLARLKKKRRHRHESRSHVKHACKIMKKKHVKMLSMEEQKAFLDAD